MRWTTAILTLIYLLEAGESFLSPALPRTTTTTTTTTTFPSSHHHSSSLLINTKTRDTTRRAAFIIARDDNFDEDPEEDDEEDEEEEDPYTQLASSEFEEAKDNQTTTTASSSSSSALIRSTQSSQSSSSSLSTSDLDWGGALGKLRQRVNDIESGKSQDPSNALFRLFSAKTPNQLIGTFVSQANPKVVKACSDAVTSLLGGLSSPAMGVETLVKTNGEKIGTLCFQLQMTGYMFRNAEYVLALKDLMNIKGSATLQDYKDAFDRLDSDDSGFIESREVQELLDDVYDGQAPSFEVEAFVGFFDKNKDGKISWSEFESGLGAAMAQKNENPLLRFLPDSTDDDIDDDDDDDDVTDLEEPEISGQVSIELESGEIVKVEAKEYIQSLKQEAEALKDALRREQLGPQSDKNNNNGSLAGMAQPRQQGDDFGGIAQYIASRQGDIQALTEGIQPEIVETMKMLVDFVLEGGDSGKGKKISKEEVEMELPGSALQQLALWQLVLGYRLREAEATGEYLKLLE